jgi:hypothetical protein
MVNVEGTVINATAGMISTLNEVDSDMPPGNASLSARRSACLSPFMNFSLLLSMINYSASFLALLSASL